MVKNIFKLGTDIEEEELKEIHELQSETILSREEETMLSELATYLKNMDEFFITILDEDQLKSRMIALAFNRPGDERYDLTTRFPQIIEYLGKVNVALDEAKTRLESLIQRAKRVNDLITRIEKEVRILGKTVSRRLPRKGKNVIGKIIEIIDKQHDQRINIKRRINYEA